MHLCPSRIPRGSSTLENFLGDGRGGWQAMEVKSLQKKHVGKNNLEIALLEEVIKGHLLADSKTIPAIRDSEDGLPESTFKLHKCLTNLSSPSFYSKLLLLELDNHPYINLFMADWPN